MTRMARAPEGPAAREGTSILPSTVLGLLTVVLLAGVLRGLAGPHILPEYLASRYVALILTVHGLLAMVMGFTGGARKEPASVWVSGGVGLLVGGVASLVYAHRGLVPGGVVCPAALASGSLVLAVIGAVIARQFEQRPLAPALAYCGLLLAILAGLFVKTGVVSGTITRPVNMVTLGMMTGQKDEPVPDVPVVLASPDGKRRLYETRTNAAGNYVFNGPPPGSYSLFVQDTEPVRGRAAGYKARSRPVRFSAVKGWAWEMSACRRTARTRAARFSTRPRGEPMTLTAGRLTCPACRGNTERVPRARLCLFARATRYGGESACAVSRWFCWL